MKRFFLALAIVALMCTGVSHARVIGGYSTSAPVVTGAREGSSGVITLKVDSIDFRNDLTRVYARIFGRPNTSQRIDAATLTIGKRSMAWTDVDGIEMKHYFQFEEDGVIPVEMDFPATGASQRGSVTLVTVYGNYTYNLR